MRGGKFGDVHYTAMSFDVCSFNVFFGDMFGTLVNTVLRQLYGDEWGSTDFHRVSKMFLSVCVARILSCKMAMIPCKI